MTGELPAVRGGELPERVERRSTDLVRCGAELVGLVEHFQCRLFRCSAVVLAAASVAALAMLPLRRGPHLSDATIIPIVVAGILVPCAALAAWRPAGAYRLLRRRPSARLALTLAAAALVAHPDMSSALWWPSCALLVMLATVTSLRWTLGSCAAVLATNLAGHVVADDLASTAPIEILGLWIGLPLWSAGVAACSDLFAVHLLCVNARATGALPPRRVVVTVAAETTDHAATGGDDPTIDAPPPDIRCQLSARQLQVAVLLADGRTNREMADSLSVSVRQVQRYVADAIERMGVSNRNELAAAAIRAGIVPSLATEHGR